MPDTCGLVYFNVSNLIVAQIVNQYVGGAEVATSIQRIIGIRRFELKFEKYE